MTEPAEPAGPGNPTEPDEPAEPTEQVEPAEPAQPEAAADGAGDGAGDTVEGTAADAAADGAAEDRAADAAGDESGEPAEEGGATGGAWRRFGVARVVLALLLALLGFSMVVQVRSVSTDPTLAALGQEDLVRILANLDAHEERLRDEIAELEQTERRLTSTGQSRQEALEEARRRADELGILAGTEPTHGPGVEVQFCGAPQEVLAARVLDAVQELRSAGAEAMQIADDGDENREVRVVASTHFQDRDGRVVVDGVRFGTCFTLTAIGDPPTLAPALAIPGGVEDMVPREGGTVRVTERPGGVEVSAVRAPVVLRHAEPVS